ncbi:MAG: site-2 protease family protein [Zetaproteobacteria bacterium]|nr:site-2 protease family protein [Zetaproteobacteria bacterium]
MNIDINAIMQGISIWGLPVLMAIVLHEVAHGWVAFKLGDDTAYWLGRLTLNPIKHIDPIGTLLIPIALLIMQSPFLFGYAKPVPINWKKLRNPQRDMVWVALAGPITNLILALLSTLVLMLAVQLPASLLWFTQPLALMCQASIIINLVLLVFNLIPLPPLDGGRVAVGLLPYSLSQQLSRLEPYGFMIIIVLLIMGWLQAIIGPVVMGGTAWLMDFALRK